MSDNERPTLPSLQDMFPDLQFERLRVQGGERPSSVPATPNPSLSRFSGRRSDLPLSSPRHETTQATHSPRSPAMQATPQIPEDRTRGVVSQFSVAAGEAAQPRVSAGKVFEDHLYPNIYPNATRASHRALANMDLPTYVLHPDECPPDDDRRHGCGICHRRFNRPSSLMIHMNSHTGAQPFHCPFPGCTRRFSVNSNMRRHYRNHREAPNTSMQMQPYPPTYYRTADPARSPYPLQSSPSSSTLSSFSDSEDQSVATSRLQSRDRLFQRTRSDTYPRPQDRSAAARPRACNVPGCDCDEAPSALRPAFPQASSAKFSPSPR